MADVLGTRATLCEVEWGRRVNILAVDFYDHGDPFDPFDPFDVVDALNGVGG